MKLVRGIHILTIGREKDSGADLIKHGYMDL